MENNRRCSHCGSRQFVTTVRYGSYSLRCSTCGKAGAATSWCALGPQIGGYIRAFRDGDESDIPLIEGNAADVHQQIGELARSGDTILLNILGRNAPVSD
jgi:hypothetical protein